VPSELAHSYSLAWDNTHKFVQARTTVGQPVKLSMCANAYAAWSRVPVPCCISTSQKLLARNIPLSVCIGLLLCYCISDMASLLRDSYKIWREKTKSYATLEWNYWTSTYVVPMAPGKFLKVLEFTPFWRAWKDLEIWCYGPGKVLDFAPYKMWQICIMLCMCSVKELWNVAFLLNN